MQGSNAILRSSNNIQLYIYFKILFSPGSVRCIFDRNTIGSVFHLQHKNNKSLVQKCPRVYYTQLPVSIIQVCNATQNDITFLCHVGSPLSIIIIIILLIIIIIIIIIMIILSFDIAPFPYKHAQRRIPFHCQRIDVDIHIVN